MADNSRYSRRRLLKSTLGAAGAAAAATLLPPNLQRAMAEAPRHPGSLDDIEHVVVLMLENRSFDHYFGTMPGVRGFDDPDALTLSTGQSVFHQPDAVNPDGYLLPFHLDTRTTSAQAIPSTSHAWTVQHAAVNGGRMDQWLPAHRDADGQANGPYTMGYYRREDIPFHFALAESFTVCDAYFCSLLGPTWPNRLYHWTGTIDPNGLAGGPVTSNVIPAPFRWTTYPERLTQAGVSWHVYQQEDDYATNPLEWFRTFQDARPGDPLYDHGLTIGPADQFARDALNDRLPTVSWIIPTSGQSEHPDYTPAAGADFLACQLDAVAANPEVWRKTVFIVNYDENDGLFDHMVPPMPPPGTPDEFVAGVPIGAGVRVPCVIVSPWTQGGFVAREPFDHTSVLRFLERITGVREPQISDWRRRTFGDLTSALGFPARPRPFPRLPDTKAQFWAAEQEVATLPPVTLPGADQTPPHQETTKAAPDPSAPTARSGAHGGTRPYAISRIVENETTHRSDFPHGTAGTDFPGIQESVPGVGPTSGTHVYTVGVVSFTLAVIDPDTHQLVAAVRAGVSPYGIATTPDGRLYISSSGENAVSVYDTTAGRITATIGVGPYPHGVAAAPDGRSVYVANTGPDTGAGGSRTLSVIDTASGQVTATWRTGIAPHSLAPTPDGRTLFVSCYDGLSVLDTGDGRQRALLADQAQANGVAVHPDGTRLYVVNTWQNTLSVLDTRSHRVLTRVRVGRTPWQVAVSPDGSRVYVTNSADDTVSVIDAGRDQVIATVAGVRHIPTSVTVTDSTVWVATNASATVDAIDVRSLAVVGSTPMGLGTGPTGLIVA